MARAPNGTGRLEPPKPRQGRPHYSFRIRVNGRQRRFDLGTAEHSDAEQQRATILAGMKADRDAKKDQSGSRARSSVAHVRKVVTSAGKASRTFPSLAERYWQQQEANGVKTWKEQRSVLQRFVLEQWPGDVSKYGPQSVRELLSSLDLAHKSRLNVFVAISGVFESAYFAGLIPANPCKQVKRGKLVPQRGNEETPKVRVTLTLAEVETMCAWEHPEEQHRPGTERLQGKLRLAYAIGVRHHEVETLRWNDFSGDNFERVSIYRAKKKDPNQRLVTKDLTEHPELRGWLKGVWEAAGKPTAGLLFPAMRDGKTAKAGESGVQGLSEADALRRLYKRSHGIEARVTRERVLTDKRAKAGKRTVPITKWEQVRELTDRERLVLDGSERMLRVCFHASRHAFAQALDAAKLTDEQIREQLGHDNVETTKGYLRSIGARAMVVPNVHRLGSVRAVRTLSEPAGDADCAQDGHNENSPEPETKKTPRILGVSGCAGRI